MELELKKQPEELRSVCGIRVQLCVVEELDVLLPPAAEAVTTFGGLSLCREHFEDVTALIRNGLTMDQIVHMFVTRGR